MSKTKIQTKMLLLLKLCKLIKGLFGVKLKAMGHKFFGHSDQVTATVAGEDGRQL